MHIHNFHKFFVEKCHEALSFVNKRGKVLVGNSRWFDDLTSLYCRMCKKFCRSRSLRRASTPYWCKFTEWFIMSSIKWRHSFASYLLYTFDMTINFYINLRLFYEMYIKIKIHEWIYMEEYWKMLQKCSEILIKRCGISWTLCTLSVQKENVPTFTVSLKFVRL